MGGIMDNGEMDLEKQHGIIPPFCCKNVINIHEMSSLQMM